MTIEYMNIIKVIGSTILPLILGFLTIRYNFFDFRYKQLANLNDFLKKREELHQAKKYRQDAEIQAVSMLNGLSWKEVNYILDMDIHKIDVVHIRDLVKNKLCIIEENTITIPNKAYLIKKYIKSFWHIINLLFFISFLMGFILLILSQNIGILEYFSLLVFMLGYETLLLWHFDGILSYNEINKNIELRESITVKESLDFGGVIALLPNNR